jgi:hypothetical protein
LDTFKKERRFQSPEIHSRGNYKIDKWYFMKRDDLTAYYEKFFLDKVNYYFLKITQMLFFIRMLTN